MAWRIYMIELKCPNCLGKLNCNPGDKKIRCEYCGTEFPADPQFSASCGAQAPFSKPHSSSQSNNATFVTPFHLRYWKLATLDFKNWKMLVLAAVLTTLRIAVKALSIPIGPSLKITFGFIVNALGSMIYGPVVAIATSAISDSLGWMIKPDGPYYFPFMLQEIAGGVIFALFYYRARMSTTRVMLGRLAVTVLCNLMIEPLIMIPYYRIYMGKAFSFFTWPRLFKNIALFPIQTVILVLVFNAITPVTNRMGLTYTGNGKLDISKKNIISIAVLTIVAAVVAVVYTFWIAPLFKK